ncbi:MAG TPA: ISAs1 family transposase [Terracidiphilus sp.]|jgi:predicted transposase YbfD/YdcC
MRHCYLLLLPEDADAKVNTVKPRVEGDQGSMETSTATLPTGTVWLEKERQWPGMKAIGKTVREGERAEKTTAEMGYYLVCRALTTAPSNEVARQQWDVENYPHWRLDLLRNEDQDRTRMCHELENLAALRRMALNAIEKERSKGAMRGRFERAGWNDDHLYRLLELS